MPAAFLQTTPQPSRPAPTRRILLQGVSLGALMVAASPSHAAPFRSLNQALALAHSGTFTPAPATGVLAAKAAQLGVNNLAAAAARFNSLSQALAQAANMSGGSGPSAADGLAPGGLQILSANGARTPTQQQGTYNVTVAQTQALAQLSWQTFNIGAHTKLTFDQSAGGTQAKNWIVINAVQDPLANPSQILGSISAPGTVYVLNRDGIVFGNHATINLGALVAATADIARAQFGTDATGLPTFSLYGAQGGSGYTPTFINGGTGAITVAPGASLTTNLAAGTLRGGSVMLLGANVANAGSIDTPLGQTVLAAGTSFTLRPGSQGSVTTGNTTSTTLGNEVATTNTPTSPTGTAFTTGTVANSGIVAADQGDISLVGQTITQGGVLLSTTTVNTRGTIHLLTPTDPADPASATAGIVLAPASVTEILPQDDGSTALDSQRAANVAASLLLNALRVSQPAASVLNPQLNNHSLLPDQVGESRIELSTGGTVDLQPGALAITPGGQVAVSAAKSVLLETGATLDVAGNNAAVLPASVNDLLVNVQPYQLRDSAANRTGGLKSTQVHVDARTLVEIASGAYGPTASNPLGNIYTPGGLLEVGGYLGLVPHSIAEWTAIGGQVTLQSQTTVPTQAQPGAVPAGAVITQAGSTINLTGGTVTYAAGLLPQTYVQTSTGQVVDINSAPGNLVYAGLYTGQTFSEPRWHVTDTYINPLLTPAATMDPGYTVGRDAGSLTVSAPTAALAGTIAAGISAGLAQTGARPALVSDPYLLAQTVVPLAGSLQIGTYATGALTAGIAGSVLFGPSNTVSPPATPPTVPTVQLDATQIAASGLARVAVTTTADITVAAPLAVADGGSISLAGSTMEVTAPITARGGSVTLTNLLPGTTNPLAPPTPTAPGAITLAAGATLDARGVWTNAAQAPGALAGEALTNGGAVLVQGVGTVDLQAGSRIDVSSGGAVLQTGKPLGGVGGSITVVADLYSAGSIPTLGTGTATFDGTFDGLGTTGGGTLSLTAPRFLIGAEPFAPGPHVVLLGQSVFQSGFSSYLIDGLASVAVLPGTQLGVAEPIYVPATGPAVPTGGDPSSAYTVVLPPLFTPVRGGDTASRRAGASITLLSDNAPASANGIGGEIAVGAGATVSVDPGQSIIVAARGSVLLQGTLDAPGGSVELASTITEPYIPPSDVGSVFVASHYRPGLSVWIDSSARIDVSGAADIFTDPLGRRFGSVSAGGTIVLGTYGGGSGALSTLAQVIERPGAILDADGAAAGVDVVAGDTPGGLTPQATPVTLASAGGTILARSIGGIALDGGVSAHAGGIGASGGLLSLQVDVINYSAYSNIPGSIVHPAQITVTQQAQPGQPAGLAPGQFTPDATFAQAATSQAQIDAGGFSQVSLSAADYITFAGTVSLTAARSITLTANAIGDLAPDATVGIAAPYVRLGGFAGFPGPDNNAPVRLGTAASLSLLTVHSDLLDVRDGLLLGGTLTLGGPTVSGVQLPPTTANDFGFSLADLESTGDIRFLGQSGQAPALLASSGDITFRAAQLYPVSGQATEVFAGVDVAAAAGGNPAATGVISVFGQGAAPAAPYSVGGSLALIAGTVVQDGIVRAPQGSLRLGWDTFDSLPGLASGSGALTQTVTLGAGSITSVSMAGQTIPYGGTVDGVNYLLPANTGAAVGAISAVLTLESQSLVAEAGSTVDLRGGGTLSGAGFVVGRGGSADVLRGPLLVLSGAPGVPSGLAASGLVQTPAVQPADAGDPVYAILPGYQSGYAPATGRADAGYATPALGEQITIGTTVPGLAAGTYTLLPAYYALLPGGYRVELTPGTLLAGTQVALGNFSVAAPVITSVANTTLAAQLPQAAIFTSSSGIRQLAQYDEESYNAFETATSTQFGAPRIALPQDAKTLVINYPATAGTGTSLSIAPGSVLKTPDPVLGGYGATVSVTSRSPIDLLGPGDTANAGDIAIDAAALSALDAPRLVIGGTVAATLPNEAVVTGVAPGVTLMAHAVLTAGDVMLTTTDVGSITVSGGATISAIGAGPPAFDLTNGFYFAASAADPVLDVSNGHDVFLPSSAVAAGASIAIGDGAALLAGGSLNIVAPAGTSVGIGAASLGGRYVSVAVGDINFGTLPPGSNSVLPTGLSLSPSSLATLLAGNPAIGVPAATQLTLTASQAVNIVGSATLDTGPTALVLNTPAIYGYGTATDTARISTTASFTWGGVEIPGSAGNASSALPGGQIAGSAASVTGSLVISAGSIVIGYGPQTQPDQTRLDRLLEGFASVTLQAGSAITTNNQNSLSVFATQADYGQPGTGGNLTLSAPLVTADAAGVLHLVAGGALDLVAGGALDLTAPAIPASTAQIATLGGELDLTAQSIALDTAVALPAGRLTLAAQDSIAIEAGAHLDLAGHATALFDQVAVSPGGTMIAESTAGSVTEAPGAVIDVSAAPSGKAGSIAISALASTVALDGTLSGAAANPATSGSLSIIAGTLTGFDPLNASLDGGGFFGARTFEAATGDIAIDTTVRAHTVSVSADSGSIAVSGRIDASGTTPGSIALYAGQTLTLDAGGALDAHATQTVLDSYGQPIDAENRAHVALAAAAGMLTLNGGTIDVSYPGQSVADILHPNGNPEGQVSLYAPRLDAIGAAATDASRTYGDVALSVGTAPVIGGAAGIALYATATYVATDPLGTIGQGSGLFSPAGATVTLAQIDADNTAFIAGFGAVGSLRLAGLTAYGPSFHVRPGVTIASSAASNGSLTISGDLDFSGLRYDAGTGYGTPKTAAVGSGEPGSIVFRAASQLTVNGSVSDGFAAPLDGVRGELIPGDNGWVFISPPLGATPNPLAQDIYLPSSLSTTTTVHGTLVVGNQIELGGSNTPLGTGTTFDTTRAVALNYAINIAAALTNPNTVIPFALTLGADAAPIPPGGWVATAPIMDPNGTVLYAQGTLIPAGTVLTQGDTLARGTVLPLQLQSMDGTDVPAGTRLNIFAGDTLGDSFVTEFNTTAPLPANALLPANTVPIFVATDGAEIARLDLRPVVPIKGDSLAKGAQGKTYPLSSLLPAGSLSWDMAFVAGANQASADSHATLPRTVLAGGALAATPTVMQAGGTNLAPGSLLLDDQHDFIASNQASNVAPAFSVIRTGTGDLSLQAGGDFNQSSLYGIYTAGSQTSLGSAGADLPFRTFRNFLGALPSDILPGTALIGQRLNYLINHTDAPGYTNGGGDLRILAQGSITADQLNEGTNAPATDQVGNWLFRQGGAAFNQQTAWWINYGTVASYVSTNLVTSNQLIGFEGVGTLGGGNVSVIAGTDAGELSGRGGVATQGIVVAVGGTGRVLASGGIVLTGGGSETVQVGGALNPLAAAGSDATNGDFIDIRGPISVTAASVGSIQPLYPTDGRGAYDPRALDPFTPDYNGTLGGIGGPVVVPGDGTVQISTLRDLVLGGAGDPGRVAEDVTTYVGRAAILGKKPVRQTSTGGETGFSLWTSGTGISLFSAAGNVTPTTQPISVSAGTSSSQLNDAATDYRFVYPANLFVTAATGSIVYGSEVATNNVLGLETAPAPNGQVAFLAGTSIFANDFAIDMSGASVEGLSTPFDPAYFVRTIVGFGSKVVILSDIRTGLGTNQTTNALFALEADTPTGNLHANDAAPELFYAAGGDIVNLVSGQTITFPASYNEPQPNWYLAAKPVRILASQDIVSSGTRPDAAQQGIQQNQQTLTQYSSSVPTASGDLFLNTSAQSASVVSAGRDILSGYFYVGGPGVLEVDAGRNLFQGGYTVATTQVLDFGAIRSLGPLLSGTQAGTTGGADLAVLAGIGTGVDYTAFASLYFNLANQANPLLQITDPANRGKVQQAHATDLTAWLLANYPTLSLANGALAAFATLPQVDQDVFVRKVFFEETLTSGRQYNDPASRFFGSYARGRQAIDTLFPSAANTEITPGVPAGYVGAITMSSGPVTGLADANGLPLTFDAGLSTQSGGTVQVLDPGGQVVLGTGGGAAPGIGSGIIGSGVGDVDLYVNDSILLGRSRIFTTGGGNILAWSSQGDINAGIGASTTVVYSPPTITYSADGQLTESASAPSSGAGIATLQPLPGIAPGNVDLIAPLGTIDAGEAGIRVAGNLNLAAARLANTANITVAGKTTGNASAPSVSLGAVEAAGAAAGAASNAAQNTTQQRAAQEQPSVIEVEVSAAADQDDEKRRRQHKG